MILIQQLDSLRKETTMKDRQLRSTYRKDSSRRYSRKNRYALRSEETKKVKTSFWKSLKEKISSYFGNLFGSHPTKSVALTKQTDKKEETKTEERKAPEKSYTEAKALSKPTVTKSKEQGATYKEWSPKATVDQGTEPTEAKTVTESLEEQKEAQSSPPAPSIEELVTSNKLYVGNLPYNLTDSDLFEIFAKVGPIKNVEIIRDRRTNRTKGFGFVEMADLDSARKAVTILNRIEVMGRRIIVTGAKSEKKDSTQE